MPRRTLIAVVLVTAALVAVAGCGSSDKSSAAKSTTTAAAGASTTAAAAATTTVPAGPQKLVGLFKIDAGACTGDKVSAGSYFQMVFPGGSLTQGKFFQNPDSTCANKAYTLFTPGKDGGLRSGEFQPHPTPAYDPKGNALADAITQPGGFTAIKFSISTNPVEPQTKKQVDPPSFTVTDGKISGQTTAIVGEWNNQASAQGSPKPDGSSPGLTRPVHGTYDAASKHFVIEWSSQVVGGPFNDFTGVWHLEGTFVPKS